MRRRMWVAFTSIVLFAAPSSGYGQACLGVPSSDGQVALEGVLGFSEGAKSYGGNVSANLRGPLSIFGGYELTDFDDVEPNANSFGAGASFELDVPNVSICPGTGITYTRIHEEEAGEEVTISQVVVPVGLGIGKRFPAGDNFYVTLFGTPQFLYIRTTVDLDTSIGSGLASESENEFGAVLGARFGTANFYAGGAVSLTTIDNSDPAFSITLGIILGNR